MPIPPPSMKLHLLDGNCASVESKAREIKSQMTVLLVQGLTRAIYALDVVCKQRRHAKRHEVTPFAHLPPFIMPTL